MPCRGWGCATKKILGYKERKLEQRKRFLRWRERYVRRGKHLVYVDECGFAPYVARRYAYAPKGRRVYGLTSGQRQPRTSLIAARMEGELHVPVPV